MSLLVGTNFYAARGDEGRRQDGAIRALRALPGVERINVQWADDRFDVDGIETVAELRSDSRTVSGRDGRRKPLVSEILDVLCRHAEARGCRHFLFANADIEITAAAVELVARDPREGFALARTDFDPATRGSLGVMQRGTDALVFDTAWWRRHASRFRPYILGEPVWDNVYTAILLVHSNAAFANREGLLAHELHGMGQRNGAYDDYTWYLAALDRPYFSLWAAFHDGLERLGDAAAEASAVEALRMRIFDPRVLRQGRALQWARAVKARVRYARRRRGS